jgi:hypothetical protein
MHPGKHTLPPFAVCSAQSDILTFFIEQENTNVIKAETFRDQTSAAGQQPVKVLEGCGRARYLGDNLSLPGPFLHACGSLINALF